ncbi:lysM domain-containing protein [Cinnamomum micranthum f. kanehirae]|uniref:LysM domain-containing protein n=1 Tax=Cinnamomum micranthum f. kanehirae TaxID=337451 RepID=A0A3S3MXW3_9MAGN|nr:lysM domain-containing protein [Cinnamomum micranthum f. kanehirae]
MMSPLLHLLLLFSCILSATSITFRCTTRPKCQGMIGYISPNTTTLSSIKHLFGLESVYSLLAANSWPTKNTNRPITAGSTVRIPFPCSCSNGTGISDGTPVYSVKQGYVLDYIARTIFREFVTYQEIAAVNNIPDPNLIDIGQKLWIPLPCSCDDVAAARVVHYGHVVANGSSVGQIAEEFGTTEATLMGLNNDTLSDPNNLQAGQILDVPIKACSSSMVSSLLVPNGSYALTANNCVQCSCNSKDLKLHCKRTQGVPVSNWTQCPSTQCNGNLSLGESKTSTCLRTTCDYAGYNEKRILTVLTNQSACSIAPAPAPAIEPPAPTPAPANSDAPAPAPAIEPPSPAPAKSDAPAPAPANSDAPAPTPTIEPPAPAPTIEPPAPAPTNSDAPAPATEQPAPAPPNSDAPAPANSDAPTPPTPANSDTPPPPAPANSNTPPPPAPANSDAWHRRNGRTWSGLLSFVFGLLCLIFP